MEGLRSDRMGCYGHHRPTTPQLDRLAEGGVLFTRAYATDTPGCRALVNVLSGRQAGQAFEPPAWVQGSLAGLGFLTMAVIPQRIRPLLGPGWNEIVSVPPDSQTRKTCTHSVAAIALRHLEERRKAPSFLLLYLDETLPPHSTAKSHFFHRYWPRNDADPSEHPARDWAMYDASIRSMDQALQPLLEVYLREKDALIWAFSLCGTLLGEKGSWAQASGIHEARQQAAMLLRFSGNKNPALSVGALVSLLDLFPTLMCHLNQDVPSTIQGQSLLPLVRGTTRTLRDTLFLSHMHEVVQHAVLSNHLKLIQTSRSSSFDFPRISLYDLIADPREEMDGFHKRTSNMSNRLCEYKSPKMDLPQTMLSWKLYGAGMENLGKDGQPEIVPLPKCGPRELILRVDAVGLCFSDTKVIKAGSNHPRLLGRNLQRNPTVLGHEVAGTVFSVGDEIRDRFKPGERYVVQADVYYQGQTMAYGYVHRGGLRQYTLIPYQMVDGDEGTYLLPLGKDSGYSQGALVEPWACVIAAFNIHYRNEALQGGHLCIVAEAGTEDLDLDGLYAQTGPSRISLVKAAKSLCSSLGSWAKEIPTVLLDSLPEDPVDDLLLVGKCDPADVSQAFSILAVGGILCQVGPLREPWPVSMDIGRIHYDHLAVLGTETYKPADAYRAGIRSTLVPGGKAWFVGAGGPMGRMHVQQALEMEGGPRVVVASEVSQERLDDLLDSFLPLTQGMDKKLIGLNPMAMGEDAFGKALREIAPSGFEDIILLAPVPRLIEGSIPFASKDCVLNAFAGLSRGTVIQCDLSLFARCHGLRAIGSSGSRIEDMSTMMRQIESGQVDADRSVAAICGIYGVHEGLQAVIDNRYPGKIVVYPHITDLGLISLDQLHETAPTVASKLKEGRWWCKEAEEELLLLFASSQPESQTPCPR